MSDIVQCLQVCVRGPPDETEAISDGGPLRASLDFSPSTCHPVISTTVISPSTPHSPSRSDISDRLSFVSDNRNGDPLVPYGLESGMKSVQFYAPETQRTGDRSRNGASNNSSVFSHPAVSAVNADTQLVRECIAGCDGDGRKHGVDEIGSHVNIVNRLQFDGAHRALYQVDSPITVISISSDDDGEASLPLNPCPQHPPRLAKKPRLDIIPSQPDALQVGKVHLFQDMIDTCHTDTHSLMSDVAFQATRMAETSLVGSSPVPHSNKQEVDCGEPCAVPISKIMSGIGSKYERLMHVDHWPVVVGHFSLPNNEMQLLQSDNLPAAMHVALSDVAVKDTVDGDARGKLVLNNISFGDSGLDCRSSVQCNYDNINTGNSELCSDFFKSSTFLPLNVGLEYLPSLERGCGENRPKDCLLSMGGKSECKSAPNMDYDNLLHEKLLGEQKSIGVPRVGDLEDCHLLQAEIDGLSASEDRGDVPLLTLSKRVTTQSFSERTDYSHLPKPCHTLSGMVSEHFKAETAQLFDCNLISNISFSERTHIAAHDSDVPAGEPQLGDTCPQSSDFSLRDFVVWKTCLLDRCIAGLHLCLVRFPKHYKSLYRLAHLYYSSDTHKVRNCLIGCFI